MKQILVLERDGQTEIAVYPLTLREGDRVCLCTEVHSWTCPENNMVLHGYAYFGPVITHAPIHERDM